ncbi:MAG: hypothetical protein ACLPYZ_12855 [Limisphaerales bacterium]
MKMHEAAAMLQKAPRDEKPSRVNKSLTREQAVKIVTSALPMNPEEDLSYLIEKRVHQVCQDRIRPKY